MFENLQVFRMAHAMATHAGTRQTVIARNMANADTPGYRAQDIEPFQADTESNLTAFAPRATRATHLNGNAQSQHLVIDRAGAEADPNGNSVSLETEMIHAVDTKRQHDRALAIYRHSLTVLRSAVSRR